MKDRNTTSTPFVFVLMPFDKEFDDIYQLGIKSACIENKLYCERVDEQIFQESILSRVYDQIEIADLIIADMTDRNANVFYEVGYAHALGKSVILLTQSADDIPFDLKHFQHVVYGGRIIDLCNELTKILIWYSQNIPSSSESRKSQPQKSKFGNNSAFIISIYYFENRIDDAIKIKKELENEGYIVNKIPATQDIENSRNIPSYIYYKDQDKEVMIRIRNFLSNTLSEDFNVYRFVKDRPDNQIRVFLTENET